MAEKAPIRITDIGVFLPETRLSLEGFQETSAEFLREKTGFSSVARKGAEQATSDLACAAMEALFQRDERLRERIELLIVVTQNPDGVGLPHTSAIVHGRLSLPKNIAAFDVSLGCSGWVYAVDVAAAFLDRNNMNCGVVVTADPYSAVLDENDRNTMLLFGDAAAATVLERQGPGWIPDPALFGTDGTRHADLEVDIDGKLQMKGRAIFEFSAIEVPKLIGNLLESKNLKVEQVDRFLLHQASRFVVETIGRRIDASDRTPFIDNGIGNTVSSTLPMLLAGGICDDDSLVVTCGFGVGLSWAGTVMRRVD
jgi:3-oxoacyl-[acyl-carrier-protein] synthase III